MSNGPAWSTAGGSERGISKKTQVVKHLTGMKVESRCGQLAESLELNGDKDTEN